MQNQIQESLLEQSVQNYNSQKTPKFIPSISKMKKHQ